MKKLAIFTVLALAFSAAASADNEIKVPRAIRPVIAVTDESGIKALLGSLIRESEVVEKPADLVIYDDADVTGEDLCTRKGAALECRLSYLNDRWNGTVFATLALSEDGSKIVELTKVDFDGSL